MNEFLPTPFIKGKQPNYLDDPQEEGALVINTGAVRPLSIVFGLCRKISPGDYDSLSDVRKLVDGDVLLTTDGGTSIGKAAVFRNPIDNEGNAVTCGFTVDSHVAILRPRGLSPTLLSYLLCSPMGQIQFQRAESGDSGQTAASEDDIRRFRFPRVAPEILSEATESISAALIEARQLEVEAFKKREEAWGEFQEILLKAHGQRVQLTARVRPTERRLRQAFVG